MTTTTFAIDWNATEELREHAQRRTGLEQYLGGMPGVRGGELVFSQILGEDVLRVKGRLLSVPAEIAVLPIKSISLVKHNSPVTAAVDGRYREGRITAVVDSYVHEKSGVLVQSLIVQGTALDEINAWFDALLAGEKNYCCSTPVKHRSRTVNLKFTLPDGSTVEVNLDVPVSSGPLSDEVATKIAKAFAEAMNADPQ